MIQKPCPGERKICQRYNKGLNKSDWAILPEFSSDEKESSFHLYQLRVKGASESQRDEIIRCIAEDDIAVNVHFIPLPMLTAYKNLGHTMEGLTNAMSQYENEISLPLYYNLTNEQVDLVVDSVGRAVKTVLGS